jgi:hypothetical protein
LALVVLVQLALTKEEELETTRFLVLLLSSVAAVAELTVQKLESTAVLVAAVEMTALLVELEHLLKVSMVLVQVLESAAVVVELVVLVLLVNLVRLVGLEVPPQ